jgi:hypothetical protein
MELLKILKIELSYSPVISLLGIFPKELKSESWKKKKKKPIPHSLQLYNSQTIGTT